MAESSTCSVSSGKVGSIGIGELSGLGSEGGRPLSVSCLRSSSARVPGTGAFDVRADETEATEVASVAVDEILRVDLERRSLSRSPSSGSAPEAKLWSLCSPRSS